jgi:hypothetical protein
MTPLTLCSPFTKDRKPMSLKRDGSLSKLRLITPIKSQRLLFATINLTTSSLPIIPLSSSWNGLLLSLALISPGMKSPLTVSLPKSATECTPHSLLIQRISCVECLEKKPNIRRCCITNLEDCQQSTRI